ncbi:MAG: RdgB/HAM1 family non-canonical purine NTP pyrophosphatase [Phycisphaerales bacterium]|nr:RdgB/HAM1 family non-canonical purine NTP pyrophosphatase [Phycisphaerales bacterium]MCB9835541.1 RdgB/HAM1 family non-canonical purine NTP pyrophosphatase [Phycisphaera sp.]
MTGPLDQPIVLASGNPKKLAEMREILGAIGLEIVGLNDLNLDLVEPEETGTTFAENARIKAVGYAEQTGRACLADDSGLVVDALGGEPGVYSARYSEDEHPGDLQRVDRDRFNNEKLLRKLADRRVEERTARFICAMCLVTPVADKSTQILAETQGTFEGVIGLPGDVPRGSNGFGYDPLFLVKPDLTRTSAELSPSEKHTLSHRGFAARAIAEKLHALKP